MSIAEHGLPRWLLTRRMAVASGIAIAALYIIVVKAYAGIDHWWADTYRQSPICFSYYGEPKAPRTRRLHTDEERITRHVTQHRKIATEALAASDSCRPGECPNEAGHDYQKAITRYVRQRSFVMAYFDLSHGDPGRAYALRTFDHPDDDRVVEGFRERHAAGLVDIPAMRDYAPPARMLLYRPPSEFLPCRLP